MQEVDDAVAEMPDSFGGAPQGQHHYHHHHLRADQKQEVQALWCLIMPSPRHKTMNFQNTKDSLLLIMDPGMTALLILVWLISQKKNNVLFRARSFYSIPKRRL
jgi:hypothetical protein